jgi:hypothetical protein
MIESSDGIRRPWRWATSGAVFVNAMIPRPGETPGEWWENVDSEHARKAAAAPGGYSAEFDLTTYFMHDIPEGLAAEMRDHASSQLDERFDDAAGSSLAEQRQAAQPTRPV